MLTLTSTTQALISQLAQHIASTLASDCEADALLPEVENDLTDAVEKIVADFADAEAATLQCEANTLEPDVDLDQTDTYPWTDAAW